MIRPWSRALVAIALILMTTAGCRDLEIGRAAPAVLVDSVVPVVASPLDVAGYEADPCRMVDLRTADTLSGGTRSRPDRSSTGYACTWGDDRGNGVRVGLVPAEGGLSSLYSRRAQQAYFEPVPDVDGYPGVFVDLTDERPTGTCSLTVALRQDRLLVTTSFLDVDDTSLARQPCAVVRRYAEAAIATMKRGS